MKIFYFIMGISLTILVAFSCGTKKSKIEENIDKDSILYDSMFKQKNIPNTDILDKAYWDFKYLYNDSLKLYFYSKLANKDKLKFLSNLIELDTNWIKTDIQAFYISKQKKIHSIQPIIILALGTDYRASFLILFDKQGKCISGMLLNGGEVGGPQEDLDSLMILRPYKRCFFKDDKIITISIRACVYKNREINKLAKIDSVIYLTTIDEKGQFKTIKKDSFHYNRYYNW